MVVFAWDRHIHVVSVLSKNSLLSSHALPHAITNVQFGLFSAANALNESVVIPVSANLR